MSMMTKYVLACLLICVVWVFGFYVGALKTGDYYLGLIADEKQKIESAVKRADEARDAVEQYDDDAVADRLRQYYRD